MKTTKKTYPVLLTLFFLCSVVMAQGQNDNGLTADYGKMAPGTCDSFNYILRTSADKFSAIKGGQTAEDSYGLVSSVYSRMPGAISTGELQFDNNGTISLQCPFGEGTDSAGQWMIQLYLRSNIYSCLLNGPAASVVVNTRREGRTSDYYYTITSLKPGEDPRLKNIRVHILFMPMEKDGVTMYYDHVSIYI